MKPMLAGKCEDIHSLRYPVYVSPKLDGVRAIVIEVLSTAAVLNQYRTVMCNNCSVKISTTVTTVN